MPNKTLDGVMREDDGTPFTGVVDTRDDDGVTRRHYVNGLLHSPAAGWAVEYPPHQTDMGTGCPRFQSCDGDDWQHGVFIGRYHEGRYTTIRRN